MRLHPCPRCRRHARIDHATCPFCGASIPNSRNQGPGIAARLTRATIFAGATLATGCHPTPSTPPQTAAAPPAPADAPRDTPPDSPFDALPPVDAAIDAPIDAAVPTKPAATTGTIRGQVTDYDGRALAKMKVTVQLEKAEKPHASTRSDRNGYYRFDGLAPGMYRLTYRGGPKGQFTTPRTVVVIAGDEQVVDVSLEPVKPPKPNTCCMPYGAPPSRRRVV
jgi:hypothetical protein